MERLQHRGIIEFAMLAEPSKLGYEIRATIGLRVELTRLDEIAETLRNLNEVTFAAFLTGSFDVMIQVVVQSQEALVKFLTQQIARIDGVRSTETFVMPWIIKPLTSWILPEFREPEPTTDDFDDLDENGSEQEEIAAPRRKRGRPRKAVAAR